MTINDYMQSGVPQAVLDYYRGYTPFLESANPDRSQLGGWWQDNLAGRDSSYFTDQSGGIWMPYWEGGTSVEDRTSGNSGALRGYLTGSSIGQAPGQNGLYNLEFDPSGQYTHNWAGEATIGPLRGLAMVAGAALGMNAAFGGLGAAGAEAGGSGAFVGEGAASGVPAWDAAYAGAAPAGAAGGSTAAMGAGSGGYDLGGGLTMGADGSIGGTTYAGGGTMSNAGIESMMAGGGYGGSGWTDYIRQAAGNMDFKDWAGLASTVLGAYGGSKGQEASSTSTRDMDPRMAALFYGGLAPQTMGLLGAQQPMAAATGGAMVNKGMGLLGQTAPQTATNPYATGILDDLQRRQGDLIARGLQQTKGNFVATGGLGGSRQGVAEADAITRGADNFTGQAANFMGGLYNADQNRLRQDWALGSGMVNQGMQTPWMPIQNATNTFAPFTGFGTTTNTAQQGGGWMGALGGALGAAQTYKNIWG